MSQQRCDVHHAPRPTVPAGLPLVGSPGSALAPDPPSRSMNTRHSGFTLFELMIALAMVGILVGVAAPSFNIWGHQTRVVTSQNDFVTALNYSRS